MSAATRHAPATAPTPALPAVAWRELSIVAGLFAVVLTARVGRYPFWGDELYLVPAGRRPSWSYADQGPLVPLQAQLSDLVAPGSAVALRLPVVVLTVATVLLAALIARELGGGRAAQLVAALGYICTPFAVQQSAAISTFAYDAALASLACWLLIRWVRTRHDGLLFAAGVVAAVDFQVKWLVLALWALLALGVLLWGPREALRRPALWLGSALLALSTIPALLWQAGHGWPQLAIGAEIRSEQTTMVDGQLASAIRELILTTGPGGILLLLGIWAVARAPRLRPYRFLLPLGVLPLLVVLAAGLRPYYLGDGFAVFSAVAAVYLVGEGTRDRIGKLLSAYFATGVVVVVAAVCILPLPQSWLHGPAIRNGDMAVRAQAFGLRGWPQLVETVERAVAALPEGERSETVIVTQNYWQASALDVLSRADLPPVYSPSRGYGYFGPPPDTATRVLYVGGDSLAAALPDRFAAATPVARLDDAAGFQGVNYGIRVWYCTGPLRPWSHTWPELMSLRIEHGT
ncbi:glycosyltransferase family 39 protein [Nocardia mexicana]|uniref:Dolichyl-phosphate-mannose-protein mannosyltransferase n=1 Tax=Nocardia mexicana TaxID=279262 RepID=A0A370H6F6_9NOCA|nr:glycosyltransferase family 39 protein [Nocardia mexicana]RDI51072.1 dolichyl-phosphate-mannose-protein mannosyltransferase [Nocardia mexicana]